MKSRACITYNLKLQIRCTKYCSSPISRTPTLAPTDTRAIDAIHTGKLRRRAGSISRAPRGGPLLEGAAVADKYRNIVVNRVNDSCLRLAVFDEVYRWHFHPTSDELFLVVEGLLAIDLPGGRELLLRPWQCVTIPASTQHRTRAVGRTVNLCFEKLGADTVFVDAP